MVRPIFRSLVSSVTCCCLRILSSKMCYLPSRGHLSLMQFGFPIRNHLIQLTGICHTEKMHLSPWAQMTHTHTNHNTWEVEHTAYIIWKSVVRHCGMPEWIVCYLYFKSYSSPLPFWGKHNPAYSVIAEGSAILAMKRSAAKTIISIWANLSSIGLNACVVAVPVISVWCWCWTICLKLEYVTRQERSEPCLQTSPVMSHSSQLAREFVWAMLDPTSTSTMILWNYPPPSNSHHQDYYMSSSRKSM